MPKKKRKKKPTEELSPSSLRGQEKWRVAGIHANLKKFLSTNKTLSLDEKAELTYAITSISEVLRLWEDKPLQLEDAPSG